jgi:hypothetical protein
MAWECQAKKVADRKNGRLLVFIEETKKFRARTGTSQTEDYWRRKLTDENNFKKA